MRFEESAKGITITDAEHFSPEHIFECGQAFRWEKIDGGYRGVVRDRVLELVNSVNGFTLLNVTRSEFDLSYKSYFDLDRDYSKIRSKLSKEMRLKEALFYGEGIRILRQDIFETLISFIISANNNIPRIKRIINALCRRYGNRIDFFEGEYYSFPEPQALSEAFEDDLLLCGCGYRARYIKETARMIMSKEIPLYQICEIPYSEALRYLLRCPGVGRKVADCVLLFSAGKSEAFPVDVWMKKSMTRIFGCSDNEQKLRDFAAENFGNLAGFAQQYIFYYEKNRDAKGKM